MTRKEFGPGLTCSLLLRIVLVLFSTGPQVYFEGEGVFGPLLMSPVFPRVVRRGRGWQEVFSPPPSLLFLDDIQ